MAISCEPNDLQAAAKCFECLTTKQRQAIDTYLLALIAGASTDPNILQALAVQFMGSSERELLQIQNYLLCQIAGP